MVNTAAGFLTTDSSAPSIAVIMSTYNGERYVRDQIESVLVQDAPNVRLYIRDDGSSDETPAILAAYERAGLATVTYGSNIGAASSFFSCLKNAQPADYYAFCDQDDLWLTDKLSRATAMLENATESQKRKPLLYCSELHYCDENLHYTHSSHLNKRGVSFATQLYETICSGNTMVFNEALRAEILHRGWDGAFLHDWWTSLVACAFGNIMWDEESRIMYRRTSDNVSPSGMGKLSLQLYRVKRILLGGQMGQIQQQLRAFDATCSGDCKEANRSLLERLVNGSKLSRALTPVRLRQSTNDEALLRASMLLGLI